MLLVSVVIPLYNKGLHIRRTLNSVLAQKVQNFEIIVVDDGSTDKGAEVVKSFIDSRIRLIQQENAGVSSARNRGIREAKADLIAFIDADDEWTPGFLETVLRLRERYPQAGAYSTAYLFCTPEGKTRIPNYEKIPSAPWEGLLQSYFLSAAKGEHPVCSSAVCIPKKILVIEKGFKIGAWWGEDDDLWGRIALKYPIAFSWQIGAIYHLGAVNRACKREEIVEHPFIEIAEMAINNGEIQKNRIDDLKECVARYKIVSAMHNLYRGHPEISRRILKSCETKELYKEKLFWYFWSVVPYGVFNGILLIKKNIKKKSGSKKRIINSMIQN
ncbi:glycosyltransferase family 2 protein [Methanosarcina sp.]|uniref:glycosyltransferase family 2 protein n=1 Tax=Methanosarcina sp. TaxID=2213 RepID=UPI003BB4BBFE